MTQTDIHGNPIYKTQNEIESEINRFIPAITSEIKAIYSRIKQRRSWQPPESVRPEISQFYQGLKLPIFNGRLSLLLHGLDATPTRTPSPSSKRLFDPEASELR